EAVVPGERGGDPQRLPAHLAAALAELTHDLDRVQLVVQPATGRHVVAREGPERARRRGGVARPRAALDLGLQEALEPVPIADEPGLAVALEPEGVRVAPGGQRAVREVEQREQPRISHRGRRPAGCRPPGAAPSERPPGSRAGSWPYRRGPAARRPRGRA